MAIEKTTIQTSATNADFPFPFPYLQTSHVTVGVTPSGGTESIKVENTHYKINGQQVEFETSPTDYRPAANSSVRIYRSTPTAVLESTFSTGSPLTANDLNNNFKQLLYALEEAKEAKVVTATNAFTHGVKVDIDVQNDSSWLLRPDTVNTVEVLNDAITADKLKDHASTDSERAVTTNHIRNDAVNGTKIADDSIDSEHIVADSIDTEHYAPGSIDSNAIADFSVVQNKIGNDSVDEPRLKISNTGTNGQYLQKQSGNTGGLTWASPAAGSVLETFTLPCKGKSITVQSGTYTTQNVTAAQTLTDSYADLNGSSITYTPPTGTQLVRYKFDYQAAYGSTWSIWHTKLVFDGTEVVGARRSTSSEYRTEYVNSFEWAILINGASGTSQDPSTGQIATGSWTSNKVIKMTVRRYLSSYYSKLHETKYWDGTEVNGPNGGSQLATPTLSITAIA